MNKIIITGRLTKDPELKVIPSGVELCDFTVAVDRRRKDKDGNRQSDFFNCCAWGKGAAFLNQYFKKGDGINLEGRMESDKVQGDDGKTKTYWKLQVDNIEFPHGKAGGQPGGTGSAGVDVVEDPPF